MTAPLRVVQWATGTVGRFAVEAIVGLDGLELVGALVYSDDKAGRDVGEISGIGPVGVTATTDVEEIIGLDADCVVYAAQGEMDPMGALDDIVRVDLNKTKMIDQFIDRLLAFAKLRAL